MGRNISGDVEEILKKESARDAPSGSHEGELDL